MSFGQPEKGKRFFRLPERRAQQSCTPYVLIFQTAFSGCFDVCAQVIPKAVAQGGGDVPQQVEEQEVVAVGLPFFFDAAQQVGE